VAKAKNSAENWAIARARWEGDPLCTYTNLADFLEISKQAVAKRSARDHWQKRDAGPVIAAQAQATVGRKTSKDAAARAKVKAPVDDRENPGERAPAGSPAAAVATSSPRSTPKKATERAEVDHVAG
jgi:hypothetical protein